MATLLLEDLPPEVLRQLQQIAPPTSSDKPLRGSLDQLLSLCPRNASSIVTIPPVRGERVTDTSPGYRGR